MQQNTHFSLRQQQQQRFPLELLFLILEQNLYALCTKHTFVNCNKGARKSEVWGLLLPASVDRKYGFGSDFKEGWAEIKGVVCTSSWCYLLVPFLRLIKVKENLLGRRFLLNLTGSFMRQKFQLE